MASTVSELLVKVKPEGVKQTRDELEGSTEAFGDMADETAESVGTLESFSKRWVGAGLVFAGTLGTLTAAIASRMPIIDEIAAGMDLVLTSLANKIDNSVRPSLSDLNDEFADLAQEIDDTEGAAEGIGTALAGSINIALEELSGEDFTVTNQINFVFEVGRVTFEGIDKQQAIEFLRSDIGQIGLRALTLGPVGVFVGFGEQIGQDIAEGITRRLNTQLPIAKARLDMWVNNMDAAIDEGVTRFQYQFKTGWELIINDAKRFLNDMASRFERRINDIIDALNRVPGTNIGNVSIGRFRTESRGSIIGRNRRAMNREISGIESSRRARNRQIERLITQMQNQTHETSVNIDGREVANATTPYVGQGAVNVGATGVRR